MKMKGKTKREIVEYCAFNGSSYQTQKRFILHNEGTMDVYMGLEHRKKAATVAR